LGVIIIKTKELSPSEILGIDLFSTYDQTKSMSENSGPGKFFLGGPVCRFHGKDVKCLVFQSESGGINSEMLEKCFKYMDSIKLCDRTFEKPVVVCDGHESQLGINFMQYIVAENKKWYV